MIRKRTPLLLSILAGVAVATAGCGDTALPTNTNPPPPDPGPGTPPELPPAPPQTISIIDDVDGENGGVSQPNYTNFKFWNVVSGCVDLHGPGGVNPRPGNGLYIDMDGTCQAAGTLESKETFDLHPADWRLEIVMAGNSQNQSPDTMVISVGSVFQRTVVLAADEDFALFEYNFTLADSAAAKIRLEHSGSDEQGILIDALQLRFIE
jgi:hypothetical protein